MRVHLPLHPLIALLAAGHLIAGSVAVIPRPEPPRKQPATSLQEPAARARAAAQYGRLPLYFEPNLGQTDPRVQFLARAGGYTMFLTPGEAVMVLSRGSKPDSDQDEIGRAPVRFEQAVVRMKVEGASPDAVVRGLERQPGISAYFLGNDPAKWRPEVPHYAKVTYEHVYPGVDLVYYGNQRTVEYDFIVAPGADPSRIQLAYEGAERLRVDESGDLVLATPLGDLKQHRPLVYQKAHGRRVAVAASYRLRGHKVSVELAAYDRSRPLVIDPVLEYSTYLGGSGEEEAKAIAADAAGGVYITGIVWLGGFPTENAYRPAAAGEADAFVAKLNPPSADGTVTLAYATYLGGRSDDVANALAVDAQGAAYVVGATSSVNFPVVRAYQSSLRAFNDAFVVKLGAYGGDGPVTVTYSTYLGGSEGNMAGAIAVDAAGAAYVAGSTGSQDFPVVAASAPIWTCFEASVFVTKFNPNSGRSPLTVAYSKLFGEDATGEVAGIAVGSEGEVFVAGRARSRGLLTVNANQPVHGGGETDVFLLKLNPYTGQGRVSIGYLTYFGGSDWEDPKAITVDAAGAVYITGETRSVDLPTVAPFQARPGGSADLFLVKLNPHAGGKVTVNFASYLGGSNGDLAAGVSVDSNGDVFVSGTTWSRDFPIGNSLTVDANASANSGFLSRLTMSGEGGAPALSGTTLFGGRSTNAAGMAAGRNGAVFIAATTFGETLVAVNGYQPHPGGGDRDASIFKFDTTREPPLFSASGVGSAAGRTDQYITPGELVSIFGMNLGPELGVANAGFDPLTGGLPTSLAGVSVTFDGEPAPLLYVSARQINLQVPYRVARTTRTEILVLYNGAASAAVEKATATAHPSAFLYDGRPIITDALTGALINAANPAGRGRYITIWATGAGVVTPSGVTGAPAPADPLSRAATPRAWINGAEVKVDFAGLTPGMVGLLQVNLKIPESAPTGASVPLAFAIGGHPAMTYLSGELAAELPLAIR